MHSSTNRLHHPWIPAIALLSSLAVAACDGDKSSSTGAASAAPGGTAKATAAAAATATASAAAEAPKAAELELVDYKPLGVSMQLPKGRAVVHDGGELGSMYTFSSLQVSLEAAPKPVEKDDDLHAYRVSEGLEFQKKTDENGLLLAIGSRPKEPKPVVVRAAVKGTKAHVQCIAEEGERKLAIEVCSSIRKLGG